MLTLNQMVTWIRLDQVKYISLFRWLSESGLDGDGTMFSGFGILLMVNHNQRSGKACSQISVDMMAEDISLTSLMTSLAMASVTSKLSEMIQGHGALHRFMLAKAGNTLNDINQMIRGAWPHHDLTVIWPWPCSSILSWDLKICIASLRKLHIKLHAVVRQYCQMVMPKSVGFSQELSVMNSQMIFNV